MKNTVIAAFVLLISVHAFAQGTETSQRRQCLLKAIQLLEDYEYYSSLDDEDSRSGFLNLFVNDSVQVYNDLLGLSTKNTLTVDEYIKLRVDKTMVPKIIIKNIKKEEVYHTGNVWKVKCTFQKEMSYNSKCGVLLSSKDFYTTDYELIAYITYDVESNICKFERIDGTIDSNNFLPEKYSVLQRTSARDNQIHYDNKLLSFNSYDQAFIMGDFESSKLVYKDPDVVAEPLFDKDCPELITMKYKERRLRLKLHYNFNLGDALQIEGGNTLNQKKSSSMNLGIDFGYVFPSESKVKWGGFLGVGMAQTKIDLGFAPSDYSYETKQDVDGDEYVRHYENLSLDQTAKLTDIVIPVYLDADLHFNKTLSMYLDLGAQIHLNMVKKIDVTEGSAYVYGMYKQYDNLRLDEHWGFNGFGDKIYSSSDLNNTELQNVNVFSVDAFGRFGLRINIPNSPLAVDLGLQYVKGIKDVIYADSNPTSLSPTADGNALIYNTVSGITSTEHVRNMTESFSSVKRQGLRLNLGLIFKM